MEQASIFRSRSLADHKFTEKCLEKSNCNLRLY